MGADPWVYAAPRVVIRTSLSGLLIGRAAEDVIGRGFEAHLAGALVARRGDRGVVEGLRRRWARGPLDALAWADRVGPAADRAALDAAARVASGAVSARAVLPDRFLSVGRSRATAVSVVPVRDAVPDAAGERTALVTPIGFEVAGQRWVLIDLDDLDGATTWDRPGFVARVSHIAATAHGLSGRLAALETSGTGVHAWFELTEEVSDPVAWWSDPLTRGWYDAVASSVLDAARASGRTGGHVDASAAAAGRYGRRPGWRLVDGWLPFRVRVLGIVADPGGAAMSSAEYNRARVARG